MNEGSVRGALRMEESPNKYYDFVAEGSLCIRVDGHHAAYDGVPRNVAYR